MFKPAHCLIMAIALLCLILIAHDRIKGNPRSVIWSDSEGYYLYLPGLFIIKNFHQLPHGSMWPYYNDKGEFVDKYTCGVAYFELPVFWIGYGISKLKRMDPTDYFSQVYTKAVAFGGMLISFIGLLILYKALIRRTGFSEKVAFWTILCVYLGTNLFHYSTKEMGISHPYSFFLFSVFLYHLPAWLKKPGLINSIILGLIMGWIFLIRPTNVILFLLIPLYDVYSFTAFKERLLYLAKQFKAILVAGVAAFCMLIPQLMYWKEMTGKWLYYSYTDEGFKYWKEPKIAAVLFDVQNGLLLYSPLVILMLVGIFFGLKQKKYHAPVILIIFILATYLFASWWAWWFGGAFGHRSYVEYYAILALPLAGLIHKVFSSPKKWLVKSFQALLILLMVYSIRLSYLYTTIGGPWDGADWRWNWEKYEWIMSHFFKIL